MREEIKMTNEKEVIYESIVKVLSANSIYFTNHLLDIFCTRINNNVFDTNIISSVSTHVSKQKTLVFTMKSDRFIHLKALNKIDYEFKQFINEYDKIIKNVFQNNIEEIILDIFNYNNELIFNEYYNIH